MSAVYNNAVCTIAFLFPPDAGVRQPRESPRESPRALAPCIVRKPTEAKKGIYVVPREQEDSRFLHKSWPLSTRAWTFQEHILSPRTILYGHHTIMWDCVETFSDELSGTWLAHRTKLREGFPHLPQRAFLYTRSNGEPTEMIRTLGQTTSETRYSSMFPGWARSIKSYRRRDLTKPSDRIIAFAGIAQAFQAEHGFTYLAGIWKEHLPRALLWYLDPSRIWKIDEPLLAREPIPKSVPTWSWFACRLYLDHQATFVYSRQYDKDNVCYSAQLVHFKYPQRSINDVPRTAYSDFSGLQIALEVATYTTTILLRDTRRGNESLGMYCESLEVHLASLLRVDRDTVRVLYYRDNLEEVSRPPETMYLALITEEWENFNGGRALFEGLALAPGAEKNTWRRVGYWYGWVLCPGRFEGLNSAEAILWGQEPIFLRLAGVKIETLTFV